jgi:hypothetical protein
MDSAEKTGFADEMWRVNTAERCTRKRRGDRFSMYPVSLILGGFAFENIVSIKTAT